LIELPEDDANIVDAMLKFLYFFNYSLKFASEPQLSEDQVTLDDDGSEKLFHLRVYAVADKFEIPGLKATAQHKFQVAARETWSLEDFPAAINLAYEIAPPGSQGEGLRNIVVGIAKGNIQALFRQGEGFSKMMESNAEFGRDLVMKMAGVGPDVGEASSPEESYRIRMKVKKKKASLWDSP
jgi:hypothetical protein